MKSIYFALAIFASLSSAKSQGFSWFRQEQEQPQPSELTCVGRSAGFYPHPDAQRCASFLACDGGLRSVEQTCPVRDGIQLHFSYELRHLADPCDIPERACCNCHKPTTTTVSTTTTTTPATTTTRKTTTTTTSPPRTPRPPPPPGQCYPDQCKLNGYCDCYEECVDSGDGTGFWARRDCGEDLFWLPNNITGGTCVYFENLPQDLQDKYRKDETCIPPCDWFQFDHEHCTPNYHYREAFDNKTTLNREWDLSCPQAPAGKKPLLWNNKTLTCDICDEALDHKGNRCSCPPPFGVYTLPQQ